MLMGPLANAYTGDSHNPSLILREYLNKQQIDTKEMYPFTSPKPKSSSTPYSRVSLPPFELINLWTALCFILEDW
jgi:hypothetical protein